jgi:hypothetical protein
MAAPTLARNGLSKLLPECTEAVIDLAQVIRTAANFECWPMVTSCIAASWPEVGLGLGYCPWKVRPIDRMLTLELVSNPFVPSETPDGWMDSRCLGVQVREIRLLVNQQIGLAGKE